MSRSLFPYDETGRPCPNCGNTDELFNCCRQYPDAGVMLPEAMGMGLADIGYRCGVCRWEYGFGFSEPSREGQPVELKPFRVVLEIPREWLRDLVAVAGSVDKIGELLNDLLNVVCEGAADEDSWQRRWLEAKQIAFGKPDSEPRR